VNDLIYLFSGEEVITKTKIDLLLTKLTKKPVHITRYDCDVTNIAEVINDAMTIPFLEDQKIIVIRNPRFLTDEASPINHNIDSFIKYLKNPCDTTYLIIDASNMKLSLNQKAYKALRNVAVITETKPLDDVEIKAWVVRLVEKEGASIKEDAILRLIEYVDRDMVRMKNEIGKLTNFVGKGNTITVDEVDSLVCKDLDGDIFELIKAIINKDKIKTLNLYHNLSKSTQDIMAIIGMVGRSFNTLLTTSKLLRAGYSQNDIANYYQVSSGRAYYMVRDAKSFKVDVLEDYVRKMATLDYQIKSGQIDKNIGLELLLLTI
jgi:DNA polymerase-3 subunit delta